jgi:hypothetical protein
MKIRPDNTHWKEQPRNTGQFGATGESPSHKTPISFKLPEHLIEEAKRVAEKRGVSVNLLIKEFVLNNFAQMLDNAESTRIN